MKDIWIGVVVAVAATIIVLLLKTCWKKRQERNHKNRIYKWLQSNTKLIDGKYEYRSTKAIASANNLTPDRVRYICNIDKRIKLSTGEKNDMWGLREN